MQSKVVELNEIELHLLISLSLSADIRVLLACKVSLVLVIAVIY